MKERAQFYNKQFARLSKYYQDLKAIELQGLKEVAGMTLNTLIVLT